MKDQLFNRTITLEDLRQRMRTLVEFCLQGNIAINPNETVAIKDLQERLLDLHSIELGVPMLRNLPKRAEFFYDDVADAMILPRRLPD